MLSISGRLSPTTADPRPKRRCRCTHAPLSCYAHPTMWDSMPKGHPPRFVKASGNNDQRVLTPASSCRFPAWSRRTRGSTSHCILCANQRELLGMSPGGCMPSLTATAHATSVTYMCRDFSIMPLYTTGRSLLTRSHSRRTAPASRRGAWPSWGGLRLAQRCSDFQSW